MNRKTFQYIIYIFFGGLLVLGFASLALFGFLKKNDTTSQELEVNLTVWGTVDEIYIKSILNQINSSSNLQAKATYLEKSEKDIKKEYINSLALGMAPDIILADHNILIDLEKTILQVPFTSFPLSSYENYFIPSTSILTRKEGYLGIPFVADSLVLFYNENLRLKSRLQFIPKEWSDFTHGEVLNSVKKTSAQIKKASIPLGSYSNYENAIDIFLTLLSQISRNGSFDKDSVKNIFDYYKSFSNPTSDAYTWSTSLPMAKDLFISGDLLFLPGYISEYDIIKRSNPNIIVRVSEIPQFSKSSIPTTLSKIYAFSLVKTSKNCSIDPNNCAYYHGEAIKFIFSILGIFENLENDLDKILPFPPAINGYYSNPNKNSIEQTFIKTLQISHSININNSDREKLYSIIQNVIVGVTTTERAAEQTIALLFGKI